MSRERIAAVVAKAEASLDGTTWPGHPLDDEVTAQDELSLYLGAAGMIWALRRLGSTLDLDALAAEALGRFRELDDTAAPASLFDGETGHLVATGTEGERLRELVRANERNPAWDLWGSPGTILAARAAGLDDEAERSAEILADEWERHGWGLLEHELAGRRYELLGPAHGLAGVVHALRGYLDDDELRRRVEPVFREHAVWADGAVNWPPGPGHPLDRVQWCHGAPGIVSTIGDLMPEDLLLGGAETTWRYGPLDKGPGLCHGTAGNGYALLKTYAVTGDEIWLERAHAFGDAALAQLQDRYSLMTGDIGAALFAQGCLDVDPRFPIMDVL